MTKSLFSKQLELTSLLEEDVIDATNEEISVAIKENKLADLPLKANTERTVFVMKRLTFPQMSTFECEMKAAPEFSEEEKLSLQTNAFYKLFNDKFISLTMKRNGKVINLKPENLDADQMAFDSLSEVFGAPMLLNIASQCYLSSAVGQKKTISNLLDG
jgi:hypothetical protein